MNTHNKNILLHLSLIPGIGPAIVLKIITYIAHSVYPDRTNIGLLDLIFLYQEHHENHDHKNISLSILYDYKNYDFMHTIGLSEKNAQQIVNGLADRKKLEDECALIKQYGIDLITIFDANYPENLLQIHLPPLLLYCKGGKLAKVSKCMAIVGSRQASDYAQKFITTVVPDLVAYNWTIVSGGAEGVDSMAHQATLDVGGKTIVVLGSGLMHPYPESNKELFKSVIRNGGTLVTSFSLNTRPERGHFPARNRIIAGLSQGCIVVQAAEKSGALITAQFALEQNRHIFAVPGDLFEPLSAGCHKLIKQGAKLIHDTIDILEDFGDVQRPRFIKTRFIKKEEEIREEVKSSKKNTKKIGVQEIKRAETEKSGAPEQEISTLEQDPILQLMVVASSLDELSDQTGLDLAQLQDKLFELQLEGKVRQTFSGAWERTF